MIVFAHLLNDRSGSPRVLRSVIKALDGQGKTLRLFIGSGGSGCLDDLAVSKTRYWYWRTPYRLLTLFTYLLSQLSLLICLFRQRDIKHDAVVYMNTLLPFGAAVYAKLTGKRLITHVHEISITPVPLRWFLVGIARWASDLTIYVSDAHRAALPIPEVPYHRIYNALDTDFIRRARQSHYCWRSEGQFIVLMIASLRDYKGVPELLALVQSFSGHSDIHFELVVNDTPEDIDRYFRTHTRPENFTVHPCVADTSPFYARASLVLNLSRVDEWVETFGLTILEAMAHGIPVIAPPVGGPVELLEEGVQGYLIDSRKIETLRARVSTLASNEALCRVLSEHARNRANDFSAHRFADELRSVVACLNVKKRCE